MTLLYIILLYITKITSTLDLQELLTNHRISISIRSIPTNQYWRRGWDDTVIYIIKITSTLDLEELLTNHGIFIFIR